MCLGYLVGTFENLQTGAHGAKVSLLDAVRDSAREPIDDKVATPPTRPLVASSPSGSMSVQCSDPVLVHKPSGHFRTRICRLEAIEDQVGRCLSQNWS